MKKQKLFSVSIVFLQTIISSWNKYSAFEKHIERKKSDL